MKKALLLTVTVLLVICSVSLNVFATGYCIDEAAFAVPDYMLELEWSDSDAVRWCSDDGNVEMIFTSRNNDDQITLESMQMSEIAEFYVNDLCSYPVNFTYESCDIYLIEMSTYSVSIEGEAETDTAKLPCEAYVYSVGDKFYVFEFLFYGETEYNCVGDVLDSVSSYDDFVDEETEYDQDDSIFEFIGIFVMALVGFLLKYMKSSAKNKVKNSSNTGNTDIESVNLDIKKSGSSKPVITTKKFEFNGKDVTALNERFTVGSKGSDFAAKELERERKEREKMFD